MDAVGRERLSDEAQALARQAGDPLLEAEARLLLGRTFSPPARPVHAVRMLEEAQSVFAANGLTPSALACRAAQAQLRFDLGEERAAIAEARSLLAQTALHVEDRAFAVILIGLCHSHLGELDLATDWITVQAEALMEHCPDSPLPAQRLWAQGLTSIRLLIWYRARRLWRGWPGMPAIRSAEPEPGATTALFERARAQLPPGQDWAYIEMGLQFARGLEGDPEPALHELESLAERHGLGDAPLAARALYCVGMIKLWHGHPAAAASVFQNALTMAEQAQSLALVRDLLLQLSRVQEDLGQVSEALATYRRFSDLRLRSLLVPDETSPSVASASGGSVEPGQRQLQPTHLRRALAFIEAGLGTPIKVQDVAEHCDVNRRTLELTFSEHCGDTLGGHLKRRQLEHAAAQLRCTSKPVQTVASEIGYRSPGAFARAFERQFGLTPTSWRKSGAKA